MKHESKVLLIIGLLSLSLLSQSSFSSTQKSKDKRVIKAARVEAASIAKKLKKKLHYDAIKAISEVDLASSFLEKKDVKKALKKLKSALAKIEAGVSSEKKDALLAIASDIKVDELLITRKELKQEIRLLKDLIKEHKIQEARALISGLKSEITVITAYLPLGVYPSFIKEAISELSENKIEDAIDTLRIAESSVVEEVEVLPIPLLTALESIELAEVLHKEKKNDDALRFLSFADDQLKIARDLGYASKEGNIYREIRKEISKAKRGVDKEIRTATFESIKKKIKNIFSSSQKSEKKSALKK